MKKDNATKAKKVKVTQQGSPKSKAVKFIINIAITLVFGFIYYWIYLPALNLKNEGFYIFLFLLSGVYCVAAILTSGFYRLKGEAGFFKSVRNNFKAPLVICAALVILLLVGTFFSGVIVRARAYSELLTVEEGDFATDIAEISYDKIPMLDLDSAERLGDRKLGELSDMVSQFEVAGNYTQINYQGRPVRVTPLQYGDIIKWANNRRNGIPAYIMIDMVTQNVEVVRLPEGMRYTQDEYFMRNIDRHLRFRYPTFMFEDPVFEVDEDGTPYWVCPRVVKTIGLFGGKDIHGVVLVNAVTGESAYYEDIPQWVDRAFTAELIIKQYDYHGMYANGYLNSIFGQKGVTVTTDGYNYIAMDDDVYMYTGITSVGGDESNVGFILANQRTKETKYYSIAGAEEYSAMSSAEGVVQHLGYKATFPLLLNIHGEPTYFMALKDDAGLVKMYAMVNVRQYQIVASGTTVALCEQNYADLLAENNLAQPPEEGKTEEVRGIVADVRHSVIDGESVYYFQFSGSGTYYSVKASDSELAVTINVGDTIKLTYTPQEGSEILQATGLEVLARADGSGATATVPEEDPDAVEPPDDTQVGDAAA